MILNKHDTALICQTFSSRIYALEKDIKEYSAFSPEELCVGPGCGCGLVDSFKREKNAVQTLLDKMSSHYKHLKSVGRK